MIPQLPSTKELFSALPPLEARSNVPICRNTLAAPARVCVYTWVGVVDVCVHVWRAEVHLGHLHPLISTLIVETGSLSESAGRLALLWASLRACVSVLSASPWLRTKQPGTHPSLAWLLSGS